MTTGLQVHVFTPTLGGPAPSMGRSQSSFRVSSTKTSFHRSRRDNSPGRATARSFSQDPAGSTYSPQGTAGGKGTTHAYVNHSDVDGSLRKLHVHTACVTFLERQFQTQFPRAKMQIRDECVQVRARMDQALLNRTSPVPEFIPSAPARNTSMPDFVRPKAKRFF